MIKRFNITSVMRDKQYDLTQGKDGSKIVYMTANINGEAETIRITIKSRNREAKTLSFEKNFAEVPIKGRGVKGNLLTKADIQRITVSAHGGSTLGGRPVWFDPDVKRINYDKQGDYLGEFMSEDKVLVILDNYDYYISTFDENNHYEDNVMRVEKYDPQKIWTVVMKDWETDAHNIKRMLLEAKPAKQNMLGEPKRFSMDLMSDTPYPRFKFTFGKLDDFREPLEIEADEFIPVRSVATKGKKVSNYYIEKIEEIEPTRKPEPVEDDSENNNSENTDEYTPNDSLF